MTPSDQDEFISILRLNGAETAKIRLFEIVAQDRRAWGDGKWVKVRGRRFWGHIPWRWYGSEDPVVIEMAKEWEREDKARYRWKWR